MQGLDPIFHYKIESSREMLSQLYRKMMEKKYNLVAEDKKKVFWEESFFGLNKCSHYQKFAPEQKDLFLEVLNERMIASFLYIEKSGLNFGAKMILKSDSLEDKSLYAAFAEEESRHYLEFNRLVGLELNKEKHWHGMLDILGQTIDEGEKETMVYIVHVILEGFSMTHYKGLSNSCNDERLKETFQSILRDEARHHAMGEETPEVVPSKIVRDQIFEYSRNVINFMKSSNPLISTSEILFGPMSTAEKLKLEEETNATVRSAQRAAVLEQIIAKNDHFDIYQKLKDEKVFAV